MKAQINGIEIPWSITTLEQIVKNEEIKNFYCLHEENDQELIKTFTDGFNYLKGQIVEISLTGFGTVPAIITNVNDRDINGHLTYDIVILIGERNKSVVRSTERYLWRFTEKVNDLTIEKFNKLIETLYNPIYGYNEFFIQDYGIDSICYLSGESVISYNLKQINQEAKRDLESPVLQTASKRGETESVIILDECAYQIEKSNTNGVEDNEHF